MREGMNVEFSRKLAEQEEKHMAAPTSAVRLFQDVDGAGDHQERYQQ